MLTDLICWSSLIFFACTRSKKAEDARDWIFLNPFANGGTGDGINGSCCRALATVLSAADVGIYDARRCYFRVPPAGFVVWSREHRGSGLGSPTSPQ
jgi:hypothetical protein